MPRWRFWEKPKTETKPPTVESPRTDVAPRARGFRPPPPRQASRAAPSDPARAELLARLGRRREALRYEVQQAELALRPDNPWQQRIALIDEALATIADDRAALDTIPVKPGFPLPTIPIEIIAASGENPASVTFQLAGEEFVYEEEIDWAERGHQLARPELTRRSGSPERLLPLETPPDRRQELLDHLSRSLFAFATDLRDRILQGEPLPVAATLADLASPCPACGGWRDWKGTCAECQRRAWRRQQLDAEEERLRSERASEAEQRARWAERLSVARRRLADVDAEIARLQG